MKHINHRTLAMKSAWEMAYNEPFEFHVYTDQETGDWCISCSSTESHLSFKVADHVDFWQATRELRRLGGDQ